MGSVEGWCDLAGLNGAQIRRDHVLFVVVDEEPTRFGGIAVELSALPNEEQNPEVPDGRRLSGNGSN